MSFNDRSDTLIELLEELTQEGHEYVLVGGYAVSAFNARFSTDLDIVVAPDSKADFVEFLEQRGFEETDSHAKEWFYDTEVIEYEKRLTPQQPIGFDLLVNGLGCRQTETQWSFNYLYDHSHQQEVSGGTVRRQPESSMGRSSSRQSSTAAARQTFGTFWQWRKISTSTLSRPTCGEGTTMHYVRSWSVDWRSWRATNSPVSVRSSQKRPVTKRI